jgi:hypothetical protein
VAAAAAQDAAPPPHFLGRRERRRSISNTVRRPRDGASRRWAWQERHGRVRPNRALKSTICSGAGEQFQGPTRLHQARQRDQRGAGGVRPACARRLIRHGTIVKMYASSFTATTRRAPPECRSWFTMTTVTAPSIGRAADSLDHRDASSNGQRPKGSLNRPVGRFARHLGFFAAGLPRQNPSFAFSLR